MFADDAYSQPLGEPLGPNPLGRVALGPDGYMIAMITHPDLLKPCGALSARSDEDVAQVARSFWAYCGPYQVLEKAGDIRFITNVEIALDSSLIGTSQERRVNFEGTGEKRRMVLRPVLPTVLAVFCPSLVPTNAHDLQSGKEGFTVLTWMKVDANKTSNL